MAEAREPILDVVVAGGSFAGLALALALVRAAGLGLRVGLVERGAVEGAVGAGEDEVRAFAISAGSRALLEAIGVWPALAAHAVGVEAVDITDSSLADTVRPVLLSYETGGDREPQMLIVEAWRLKAALVAGVLAEPAITVRAGVAIAGLEPRPGALGVRLGDGGLGDGGLGNGGLVAGRLVVAADGARSAVRAAAGIGVVGSGYGQIAIATVVEHARAHESRAVQHFLPGGPLALLPLAGNRSAVTWSLEERRGQAIMGLDDGAFVAELQAHAGWRLGAMRLAGPRVAWPLQVQHARRLTGARLALIGDAARTVHPIAGQGVNLGFRDVAALTEALAGGVRVGLEPADATVLERYERWRRFDGVQSAAAYGTLNALFAGDQALLRGVRDLGLGIVDRLPALKRLIVAEAAGLTGEVPRLLKGEPI